MPRMTTVLPATAPIEEHRRACLASAGSIGDAIAGRLGAVAERTRSLDRHRSDVDGGLWNAVTRTALTHEDADTTIRETIEWYRSRTVRWWTGPDERPHDLEARLARHGFEGVASPGMVCDLRGSWDAPDPPGLEIGRAAGPADARDFLTVLSAVYPDEAGWQDTWLDAFVAIGFADDAPVRIYVGREAGRPVSASFLVVGAGVAGIYGVHTNPAARGRGLGAALTRAPMRDARAAGFELAVLQAATRAVPLYARIGFRTVCELGLYERTPASTTEPAENVAPT
jgi:GNAT superfamily N-acetyltransferase